MNVVVVDKVVYINKKNKIFPSWKGDTIQESELMQKLFIDYYCRFLPFTPAIFYYIYWNNIWLGKSHVSAYDFYNDVVEPIATMKGHTYLRWAPSHMSDYTGRYSKAVRTLVNNSLITYEKLNGYKVARVTDKGVRTVRRDLESLWYYIKLVEYSLERDDKDLISKLLKIKKFKAVTPEELRKEIYYF